MMDQLRCSECNRIDSGARLGDYCGMTQPDGERCMGTFQYYKREAVIHGEHDRLPPDTPQTIKAAAVLHCSCGADVAFHGEHFDNSFRCPGCGAGYTVRGKFCA